MSLPAAAHREPRNAAARHEMPVYLPAPSGDLFAVLTEPATAPNDITVVLLGGGFGMTCNHRNDMYVRLARRLAGLGYQVLRMDYCGVGESAGTVEEAFAMDRPAVRDVDVATSWLRDRGATKLVLIGTCFGGRTALAMVDRVESLIGAALIDAPVIDYRGSGGSFLCHFRRALDPATIRRLGRPAWRRKYLRIARDLVLGGLVGGRSEDPTDASPHYLDFMETAVQRQLPLLVLFGRPGDNHDGFQRALEGSLGELFERADCSVTVQLKDCEVHGFLSLRSQQTTMVAVEEWLERLRATDDRRSTGEED